MTTSPAGVDPRPSLPLRWAFIVFVALVVAMGAAVAAVLLNSSRPWFAVAGPVAFAVAFVATIKFLDWLIA